MNNEEKARAYDKALNWMRAIYQSLSRADKEDAEHFFPELCEGEDERIRKALIGHLKAGVDFVSNGVTKAECIAWLEKQKEQKPESCDCSRDEESYTNGIHHVLMNPEAYGLIKQKPAGQLGGTFTSYDMAKTFTEGQNYVIAHPEKFGLCKPAEWSEEDEKFFQLLHAGLYAMKGRIGGDDYNKVVNRLKSIRQQLHWKPSEEEVRLINTSISFLKDFADKGYENAVECIDWLKSKLNGDACK